MKISRLTIREYAESLAIAFILAMIIRHFAVEAFRIPTSSMEPTLLGSESHGDRILVSKFQYDLHAPKPWDIIVFKIDEARINYYRLGERRDDERVKELPNGVVEYPESPDYVNYVKRLIGLPGQTVQVKDGDIFIDGRISRKPLEITDAVLIPVGKPGPEFLNNWTPFGRAEVRDGVVTLPGAAAENECDLRYGDEIGNDIKDRVGNLVGDLRLRFQFRYTGGAGYLVARLSKNESRYVFKIPLGKPGETPSLLIDNEPVARAARPIDVQGDHVIEFTNVDERIILRVDGEVLFSYDNDAPSVSRAEDVRHRNTVASGVEFGASRCDVTVRDVRLWRDIYYTRGDADRPPPFAVLKPFTLGSDEYFVMGDNSSNSFDSRNWGVVKRANLIGGAFFVFWPAGRWKFIN